MKNADNRLADYSRIPEQSLAFNPINSGDADTHPLRGLLSFGPYSSKIEPALVRSPIRIAIVTIEGFASRLRDYLMTIHDSYSSPDKSPYFPDFPGFKAIFGVDLQIPQSRQDPCALIPLATVQQLLSGPEPERLFLALVDSAVRELLIRRSEFDIIVFYFPKFLEPLFVVSNEGYSFDLHDATKAITATVGIPAQIVLDRSIDYRDRASVMWSLGIALYTKAGGIPWKLSAPSIGTAFVGLSYVLHQLGDKQRVVTCCSQVFDDQGHGLQFLLFTADDFRTIGRNPFLGRLDMRRLLSKTLDLYVRQRGAHPRRLIVHKTTQFTKDERDGAAEALHLLDAYELLQVQEDTRWVAVKGQSGKPTAYPVDRGTVLPLSKYSYLLWTQGDAFGVAEGGRSFFQEGKGIPAPLLITQHAGSSSMLESAGEIFGLTKMNWNTGRLYNNLPVTVKSASSLGRIAKYMGEVSQAPYLFRLFM